MPIEVFGRNRFHPIGDRPYSLTLAPYGFFWFALEHGNDGDGSADDEGRAAMPVPRLPGTGREVLRRRSTLARIVARWLPSRRWYAGKGATILDVSVDDVIELDDRPERHVALVIVRTSFTEGDDQSYAVPLLHTTEARGLELDQGRAGSLVALVDDGAIVDAMAAPEGAGSVAAAALRRRTRRGQRGGTAIGHPRRSGLTRLADDPRDVHPLGVEQSNSSAAVGGRVIAKLIRQLASGENPDVTLPMHLRRQGFEHVPGVAGTLDVARREDAVAANAVVVHDAIANESDLWEWSQDLLTREIERVVSEPDATGDEAVMDALTVLLARRTAEMHQALVGGERGFEAERFTLLFQRSIQQSVRAELRETQRELRRHRRRFDDELAATAATVIDDGDRLLGSFDRLRSRKLDAARIRVHGDLHLGQALWTGHDIVFIDFEGEPGRPMGERAIKRSPLTDVAGIIRSLDYAGRVALHTSAERGRTGQADVGFLERWRQAWTERTQSQYWATYVNTLAGGEGEDVPLVPADPDDAQLLLDAHVLRKALYEVRYELAHRPGWVGWPLAAVARLIEDRG